MSEQDIGIGITRQKLDTFLKIANFLSSTYFKRQE